MRSSTPISSLRSSSSDHPLGSDEARLDDNDADENEEENEGDEGDKGARARGGVRWRC